jgi:hypothetical protein
MSRPLRSSLLIAVSLALNACGGGGDAGSAGTAATGSSGAATGSSGTASSGATTSSAGASSSGSGTSSSSGGSSSSSAVATPTDVLMYHNDSQRTGQNLTETILTPANVNSTGFGLKGVLHADSVVDAAPLVVSNLTVNGAAHNVVYAASENDTVYAYDADSLALIASVSLLGAGETAASLASGCTQVAPTVGITATPVIDRTAGANGTLFIVAMSQDASGNTVHRLHALDLVSLADRLPAVVIQASAAGTGANASSNVQTFNSRQYKERGALLLSNGTIYTSWASNCDVDPYNSWVMAYSESTLGQTRVLNLTPNGVRGAIWNSGGLLDDGAGSLYALIGNGTFDSQQDYGNAAVRLSTAGTVLSVADYFTPSNTVAESNQDLDFGSGSPMLLPDQVDASGVTRQLMFAAGKDGTIFMLNRANMGQFNASANQVYQQVQSAGSVFAAPAYYNGNLYVGSVSSPLEAFTFANAQLSAAPVSKTAGTFSFPGTTPSISANGSTNAIVWTVASSQKAAAVLHAYSATDLTQEYYNSTQAGSRDAFGNGNKFITPVIANGRVFVGTPSGVAVFGLL